MNFYTVYSFTTLLSNVMNRICLIHKILTLIDSEFMNLHGMSRFRGSNRLKIESIESAIMKIFRPFNLITEP